MISISKRLTTSDHPSSSVFTLCCGFFTSKRRRDRKDSDEISKPDAGEDEKTAINGTAEKTDYNTQDPVAGELSYAQIAEEVNEEASGAIKVDENGAAYQYAESSSDSEDEVLKHYQDSVVRANSIVSGRSGKSGKSKKSNAKSAESHKSSKGSLHDLESGTRASERGAGDATSRASYNAETDADDFNAAGASPQDARSSRRSGESIPGDGTRGGSLTFENQAFMADGGTMSDRVHSSDRLTNDEGKKKEEEKKEEEKKTKEEKVPLEEGKKEEENVPQEKVEKEEEGKVSKEEGKKEHLFDVSDLQHDPPLISKCGSLEISFQYDNAHSRMILKIHQAREIPAKDRGGANTTQVRVMLLPSKKQRHKTRVKEGENPVFDEKVYFNKILPDELAGMGLRFRLYGLERMRRERMIGESIVGFASLNLEEETSHWVVLEPRSNLSHGDSGFDVSSLSRSDSGSSNQSLQHGGMPELLLGLAYNGTTGRLSVEVIKGSNFRNMAMNRAPDTYVKLSLMNSSGAEVQRCKTSIRRGQPNPLFKETFMLQVALFQLPEVTLMVSVYNKKSMKKKEMIGWFSLGMNSSGEEESSHWLDMRESKGEQVCRWHVLLES